MSLPTIAVVIPVLNNVKTIEKAIQSVLSQHYPKMQLIILDAGSTDGTIDVIKRYEKEIFYWHSKPDGGAYLAINAGADIATADVIAQLMADDWFEPGIFDLIGKVVAANPDADIVSCGGRFMEYDATTKQYKTTALYQSEKALKLDFHNICFAIPAMSSRFIKKALINKIGLFDPLDEHGKPTWSADREFLLRAILSGAKNIVVEHLGHTYFAHAGSATFSKNRKTQLKIYREHMTIAEKYLQKPELSASQKGIIRYWYNDQAVRLLIFKLLAGDFTSVMQISQHAIKQSHLAWVAALVSVPCRIAVKKICFGVKSILQN